MGNQRDLSDICVDEYTTPAPFFVDEREFVVDVIRLMGDKGIRHLPVVNSKGNLTGVISDRDVSVLKTFAFKADICAKDIMTEMPVTMNFKGSLLEAAYKMASNRINSIIITDDHGDIYGIFTSLDAVNALVEVLRGDYMEDSNFLSGNP